MGKSKKFKTRAAARNLPLSQQILEDESVKSKQRVKSKQNIAYDPMIDDKLSKKILDEARKQRDELEEEFGATSSGQSFHPKPVLSTDKDGESESEEDAKSEVSDIDGYYDSVEINEEDEKALNLFMKKDAPARRTLADIIMEKLTEKRTELEEIFTDKQSLQLANLDPRVVEVFKGVRVILSKYRSGMLPKAFKIIPTMSNWEHILYITKPEKWTAAAMYQATRLFISNLKENMAQRFLNLVLLPRIRDDIEEYKRLNVYLYAALKKALFKPGAFYKGFLLPLCSSGNCTLREAIIIGSVLAKCSIPVLHSSAAMLKLAEMDYNGSNSVFLRILLDKKYALPFRVIDALVYHFLRFQHDQRTLPVLWHQALLTFAQRYKEDISSEQKEALLELLKHQKHHLITPEIRKELQNSKCRDEEVTAMSVDG